MSVTCHTDWNFCSLLNTLIDSIMLMKWNVQFTILLIRITNILFVILQLLIITIPQNPYKKCVGTQSAQSDNVSRNDPKTLISLTNGWRFSQCVLYILTAQNSNCVITILHIKLTMLITIVIFVYFSKNGTWALFIIIIIIISLTSIFFQDQSRVWAAASQQH